MPSSGSGTGAPVTTNTYSSAGEVTAWTRHLLDGQSSFNSTTRPTSTELSKFLERVSAILNTALAGVGFTVPVTQNDARLACDDWVTARSAEYVELTQRGVGFTDAEGARTTVLHGLHKAAMDWANDNRLGFQRLGVPITYSLADGLQFTAQDAQDQRDDPDDSTLAQPKFYRGLFDEPRGSGANRTDQDEEDN